MSMFQCLRNLTLRFRQHRGCNIYEFNGASSRKVIEMGGCFFEIDRRGENVERTVGRYIYKFHNNKREEHFAPLFC